MASRATLSASEVYEDCQLPDRIGRNKKLHRLEAIDELVSSERG